MGIDGYTKEDAIRAIREELKDLFPEYSDNEIGKLTTGLLHERPAQDPYAYQNSTVLKNRFDVRRENELKHIEYLVFRRQLTALQYGDALQLCDFSLDSYRELHRFLFGNVYDWAGELRTCSVGIAYDMTAYESPETMPAKLNEVFAVIGKRGGFAGLNAGQLIKSLTLLFGSLKTLQAFRDGNTRTSAVFTQIVAAQAGWRVDFDGMDRNELDKACIAFRDNDANPLLMLFATNCYMEKDMPGYIPFPEVTVNPKAKPLAEQIPDLSDLPQLCAYTKETEAKLTEDIKKLRNRKKAHSPPSGLFR